MEIERDDDTLMLSADNKQCEFIKVWDGSILIEATDLNDRHNVPLILDLAGIKELHSFLGTAIPVDSADEAQPADLLAAEIQTFLEFVDYPQNGEGVAEDFAATYPQIEQFLRSWLKK